MLLLFLIAWFAGGLITGDLPPVEPWNSWFIFLLISVVAHLSHPPIQIEHVEEESEEEESEPWPQPPDRV